MTRNELLGLIGIVVLIIIGIWSLIPAIGLAVALAKGTAVVPLGLGEAMVVVAVGGGAVAGTWGAVETVSKISAKRRSAFVALCACGEWFIAESISELVLDGHAAIEKIIFKGSASLAFAFAAGLWSTPRWPHRAAAVALFVAPCLLVVTKLLGREIQIASRGQLYFLLALPILLAGLYMTAFALGILKEE